MKNYYQIFTVIWHLRQLDAGQSFPQNANPSCWLIKHLFFDDTFKISLANHNVSSQMLSISKRIWVVLLLFREFATVEFRFFILWDLGWSMHGMNVLYWLIDHRTTLTFSANRCSDWRKTNKTEQPKSTRLSARVSPARGEVFMIGET